MSAAPPRPRKVARPRAAPAAVANEPRPMPPAPRTRRDPWAWACALALVPLLLRCLGAPLGEPVAEDFDFLRRSLFHGVGSLLDGGGSTAFWRPVAHQLYYAALGPLIVSSPRVVAALHAILLAAGMLLVFRALRPRMSGVAAFVAATFPAFAESTRTLVSWPSQFVDVGVYLFSALALHEASRRRLPTALAAALVALLCKEVAIVTVALLPWFPGALTPAERRRWAIACGVLALVWGASYVAVRASAHLALPHRLEEGATLAATPMLERVAWALGGSLRALGSLALRPGGASGWALALALGLAAVVAYALIARRDLSARLAERRDWLAWGSVWFALATAALVPLHPHWQPNRSHFGALGAGIVSGVALEAVHPAAAFALVAGRLVLLALAPPAASAISEEAPETGAFMDFARLSRLQRFMAETRGALAREYPRSVPHTNLLIMNLPRGLTYALGGDRAAQVWYRDTTLRTVSFDRLAKDSTLAMLAGIQFQLNARPQIVLLSPDAMRAQDVGYRHLRARRWEASLPALARADSLEPDPDHQVFHGNNAGYRAQALVMLGRVEEAEREARRSVSLDERDPNAYRVLASTLGLQGRFDEALSVLDRADQLFVGADWVKGLRQSFAEARARAR